jgi:hypothetical protein
VLPMSMLKHYLVGFKCYRQSTGCECNIDIPQAIKDRFLELRGFDYDEFCLYDTAEGTSEADALEHAYAQCGAAEEETIREGFPDVEIIGEL